MNINAAIIDQRLGAIVNDIRQQAAAELQIKDETRLKSLAFTYLCTKTLLDLEPDETFDCLTEGGGDFGVDAMHISEEYDGEFTVSLFQTKYKNNLEGNANFPEEGIEGLINTIKYLFNPIAQLEHINRRLLAKVEEARSLIRDGYIPQVRALACNNGLGWNAAAQAAIDRANFGDQVTWEHINHERLVKLLQTAKPVKDTLQLSGRAIVEDMDFSRVLVGRIAVTEIATLIERHGERLLERNIRRYLGLQGNRVNEGIRRTLMSNERNNFYFYNNGITLTCDSFSYNALQDGDYQVRVENLHATNSQNPVELKDLRANDERQRRLEMDIQQLGFNYRRKRSDTSTRSTDITVGVAAEAILSVWREKPHQAKFFSREHFGKLYDSIFTEQLNGSQVVVAVQLYRIAENRRKRPTEYDPEFVRYAACFVAMQMGRRLLKDMNIPIEEMSHCNFAIAQKLIEQKGENYCNAAIQDIQQALQDLYGSRELSLQQLSATFRRGDLIERLHKLQNWDTKPT